MAPPPIPERTPCNTPAEWARFVKDAMEVLDQPETEENWNRMERQYQLLASVVRGGAYKLDADFISGMKTLARPTTDAMLSERTRLSGTAVDLMATIAPRSGLAFEPLIHLYMPSLVKLTARPNKLYISRAQTTLRLFVRNCRSHLFGHVLKTCVLPSEKSVTMRYSATEATYELLAAILSEDQGITKKGKWVDDIEFLIKATARDASPETRKSSKKAFNAYAQIWPDRVGTFVTPLSPTTKRYLDVSNVLLNPLSTSAPDDVPPVSLPPVSRPKPRPIAASASVDAISSSSSRNPAPSTSSRPGPQNRVVSAAPALPSHYSSSSAASSAVDASEPKPRERVYRAVSSRMPSHHVEETHSRPEYAVPSLSRPPSQASSSSSTVEQKRHRTISTTTRLHAAVPPLHAAAHDPTPSSSRRTHQPSRSRDLPQPTLVPSSSIQIRDYEEPLREGGRDRQRDLSNALRARSKSRHRTYREAPANQPMVPPTVDNPLPAPITRNPNLSPVPHPTASAVPPRITPIHVPLPESRAASVEPAQVSLPSPSNPVDSPQATQSVNTEIEQPTAPVLVEAPATSSSGDEPEPINAVSEDSASVPTVEQAVAEPTTTPLTLSELTIPPNPPSLSTESTEIPVAVPNSVHSTSPQPIEPPIEAPSNLSDPVADAPSAPLSAPTPPSPKLPPLTREEKTRRAFMTQAQLAEDDKARKQAALLALASGGLQPHDDVASAASAVMSPPPAAAIPSTSAIEPAMLSSIQSTRRKDIGSKASRRVPVVPIDELFRPTRRNATQADPTATSSSAQATSKAPLKASTSIFGEPVLVTRKVAPEVAPAPPPAPVAPVALNKSSSTATVHIQPTTAATKSVSSGVASHVPKTKMKPPVPAASTAASSSSKPVPAAARPAKPTTTQHIRTRTISRVNPNVAAAAHASGRLPSSTETSRPPSTTIPSRPPSVNATTKARSGSDSRPQVGHSKPSSKPSKMPVPSSSTTDKSMPPPAPRTRTAGLSAPTASQLSKQKPPVVRTTHTTQSRGGFVPTSRTRAADPSRHPVSKPVSLPPALARKAEKQQEIQRRKAAAAAAEAEAAARVQLPASPKLQPEQLGSNDVEEPMELEEAVEPEPAPLPPSPTLMAQAIEQEAELELKALGLELHDVEHEQEHVESEDVNEAEGLETAPGLGDVEPEVTSPAFVSESTVAVAQTGETTTSPSEQDDLKLEDLMPLPSQQQPELVHVENSSDEEPADMSLAVDDAPEEEDEEFKGASENQEADTSDTLGPVDVAVPLPSTYILPPQTYTLGSSTPAGIAKDVLGAMRDMDAFAKSLPVGGMGRDRAVLSDMGTNGRME